jgi:hypothetical protein
MKKDILRYFIDYCKSDADYDPDLGTIITLQAESFDRILDKGLVLTNESGEFEAPEKNVYVFASVETYLKFNEVVATNNESDDDIDINIAASVETYLKFNEAVRNNQQVFSLNYNYENQTEFLSTWLNIINWSNIEWSDKTEEVQDKVQIFDRIVDKGIVELGYLKIKNYSEVYENPEVFDRILDKGIVISYREINNNILISSVETYLKYADALGLPEPPAPPPPYDDTVGIGISNL